MRQVVFCAAARTPLTVDVRLVEEQGVAYLAAALQVGSPAKGSCWGSGCTILSHGCRHLIIHTNLHVERRSGA